MVKVGDRLIVLGSGFPAYISKIEYEPSSARTILFLDWKELGTSKIYLHDQNNTWHLYMKTN